MSSHRPQKTALQSAPLIDITRRAAPALLMFLSLSLMVLHKANVLPIERLRAAMVDAVTPVMTAVTAPFVNFLGNMDSVTALRDLKAENIRLTEENAKLQKWYETALKLQAENQSLRELLNVKADPTMSFVTTRIVSDAGGVFVKSVLVSVGTRDNVHKGSAVLSGKGLIGRVTEAGQTSARVLLITDLNSRIPITLQNTRTRAILAGKNQDLMRLERLPPDSGITVGTRVVTSGDGGQLPADIPIGTIVTADETGVWVKPLSDIDSLTHVQIVNADIDPTLSTGEVTPLPEKKSDEE